jgi:hypothetical protein
VASVFNSTNGSVVDPAASAAASATTQATNAVGGATGAAINLRFPSDLDVIDHWLDITIFEYSRANRMANASQRGIKGHITLPLPAKIATGYSQEYGNEKMGITEQAAMAVTQKIQSRHAKGDIGSIADRLAADAPGQIQAAMGLMTGFALDTIPGSTGVQLQLGMVRNPHYAVIYNGPKFRSHEFRWTFIPRSASETQTLQQIIYLLKYSQAPDIVASFQNHLLKYPDEMTIAFHYPTYLFNIGPSVLTDITVEYGGDQPAFFRDTHGPVEVTLGLTFMETTIITKSDIQTGGR